jgi:hypothetical protein
MRHSGTYAHLLMYKTRGAVQGETPQHRFVWAGLKDILEKLAVCTSTASFLYCACVVVAVLMKEGLLCKKYSRVGS